MLFRKINLRGIGTLTSKNRYRKGNDKVRSEWNERSLRFWQAQSNTNNGVLLGHDYLNTIDIDFSSLFLEKFCIKHGLNDLDNVLDCGAGIGRVSKQLLRNHFKQIDVLEQCEHFINTAKEQLKDVNIGNFYCSSLGDFSFQRQYNCIWMQWILTHLHDEDAINFLKIAKSNLKQSGFIIIKQNICSGKKLIDDEDSTIIRTDNDLKRIFFSSKFKIIQEELQHPWHNEMYEVKMYALR